MQNSRSGRLCLLMLLSFSLTACDQVMTELDQLMKTGKQLDCPSGKHCGVDITESEDLNWFLTEVKRP